MFHSKVECFQGTFVKFKPYITLQPIFQMTRVTSLLQINHSQITIQVHRFVRESTNGYKSALIHSKALELV